MPHFTLSLPHVRRLLAYLAAALVAMAAMAGCSELPGNLMSWRAESASKAAPKAGPTQVKTGGDGFALGDVERPAVTPQQFADRVAEMLRARRPAETTHWIQQYPDIAMAVLRDSSCATVSPESFVAIAEAHDQQCSRAATTANWTALARDRASRPGQYAEYDKKRQQFMSHVQNGRVREALAMGLAPPQGAPGAMLSIDCQYLTGVALVLGDRPREAVGAFQRAVQAANTAHPYQAANLLLLLSDAQRRAGDAAAAENTWRESAGLAGNLAVGSPAVADPILWERIAYLRPANTPWPPAVRQQMTDLNVRLGIAAPPRAAETSAGQTDPAFGEAALWTNIGHWRLAREESQAALVALKRAESMTSDPGIAAQLRLAQTKALVRLGQASAATAMLIALAGQSEPRIARPAMAMLGTLKLQQGSSQQGFNLLHRAVEEDLSLVWPERSQAEADLGLAYLLMGEEEPGLRWLHGAQKSFESAGQQQQLVRCLENEAAYLEQAKKKDLAKAVRQRLESLASG